MSSGPRAGFKKVPAGPKLEVSLSAAEAAAPYKVRLPTYFPKPAKIAKVYQLAGDAGHIEVDFSDGSTIRFELRDEVPDWSASEVVKSGHGSIIAFHGTTALTIEPGNQTVGNQTEHYRGSFSWVESGIETDVYGDYAVVELMKMAESLD